MATIEIVNLEDVYPLEDEYGNDMATRDYSLEVNVAYVEELARSFSDGVPDERITLVRDGGIYRIKSGNSRVRAMRLLGTRRCEAIVEDGDGALEKAIVETVVRTNVKKKYESVEESAFVRQLSMFGDDEYVSRVSGIEVADVARVRRATEVVDDAADDMSLLRLIAIGDLADDPDAVERLTNCRECEFESVHGDIMRERRVASARADIEAALSESGIELRDVRPAGFAYHCAIRAADEVSGDEPDGTVAVHDFGARYSLYVPEENVDEDEDASRKRADMLDSLYAAAEESMDEWFGAHVTEDLPRLVEASGHPSPYSYGVDRYIEDTGLDVGVGTVDNIAAYLRLKGRPFWYDGTLNDKAPQFVALVEALSHHGHVPCAEETMLCDEVRALLDGGDDE